MLVAGDRSEVWTMLFRRSQSLEQQKAILTNILKLDDRDMIPLLQEALGSYVRESSTDTSFDQKKLRNDLTLMVVKELGDLKAAETAELLMEVFRTYEDPILRSETLYAVGKMRALQYGEEISMVLRNLNFGADGEPRENEILAYGAILALERMKSPLGYEPVFYASLGWYPRRTREVAEKALETITDDPTEFLSQVISSTDSFKEKSYALAKHRISQAPGESKAQLAFQALQDGLKYEPEDLSEQLDLSELRLQSIEILNEHGKGMAEVVPFLKEVATRKWSQQERLNAILALGLNGTDEGATVLNDFLMEFNQRQIDGLNSNEDLQAIRTTIGAMEIANNPITITSLIAVEFSDFPGNIRRLAKNVLSKIEE